MSFPRISRFILASLVLAGQATLGVSGCAGPRADVIAIKAPVAKAGVVFVVDGAGDFRACSKNFHTVCDQLGEGLATNLSIRPVYTPLSVVTVPWSHGYGRIIADQIDYANAHSKGQNLAQVIGQYKHEYPDSPIYLVAHSAGSAVAITALENLPPETVQRAFLLAPSLSATYDVRPALKAVKYGLHVFYSGNDTAYLGVWTGILGNSDRRWGPSSGRIGFQIPPIGPEDAHLYSKFFQRPWQPDDRTTGNDGKHYGDYQPDFVRAHILPLLFDAH